jgi:hypothetical protein
MAIRTGTLFALPVVFGAVGGYLVGGRLLAITFVRPRALWLLWLAAAVQVVQDQVPLRVSSSGPRLAGSIIAVVFGIVLVWLLVNAPQWPCAMRFGGYVIGLGAILNGVVIAVNGHMPYSGSAAVRAGMTSQLLTTKNEPASTSTWLAFLGDVVPVSPLRVIISPGDLLIGIGTALVVGAAMRLTQERIESEHLKGGET